MNKKISFIKFLLILLFPSIVFVFANNYITQPPVKTKWFTYDSNFIDIGVGACGDIFLIKSDGKLNKFEATKKGLSIFDATPENYPSALEKVDVDCQGTPYVVDTNGNTIYLSCFNKWRILPGCAKDIGVGANGDVWKIGCDEREGGYGVWKLICPGFKSMNNCLKFSYANRYKYSLNINKKCTWYRVDGSGLRIDVDEQGNPWVVKNNNEIYSYDGSDWHLVSGFKGKDITISNDGVTFATGQNFSIGRLVSPQLGTWQILSGNASAISAGAYSIPFIINKNGEFQTVLKLN